jgi:NAD(P)-dependent dehydrogenase (short-subunit alcohol dehydrogenase family)
MPRTYVVTGSGSGIGRATKLLLEGRGAHVIGVDLYAADVVADLSTTAGREALVEGAAEISAGVVDGVIACAGLSASGASPETASRIAYASPEPIVRVNYFGAVATLEGLRPLLARSSAPRAVVIASIGLLTGDGPLVELCLAGDEEAAVSCAVSPSAAEHRELQAEDPWTYARRVYGWSKRAIARWIRREAPTPAWAGAGIPLNAIAPGLIRTPMLEPLLADPTVRAEVEQSVPMPLHGPAEPSAAAALLAWLTSEENVVVTGQVIFIDGGAEAIRRGDGIW